MLKQKKGEIGLGVILAVAIAVIMALVLFQNIASNVEQGTQAVKGTTTSTNYLITGVLNTNVELVGQELVSVTIVTNRTGGNTIPAVNYTVAECVRTSDGMKGICYKALANAGPDRADGPLNITYVYYPAGYIDDSGARSLAGIIILLTAIGIAMIAFLGIRKDIM
jgi:hypothetical protein